MAQQKRRSDYVRACGLDRRCAGRVTRQGLQIETLEDRYVLAVGIDGLYPHAGELADLLEPITDPFAAEGVSLDSLNRRSEKIPFVPDELVVLLTTSADGGDREAIYSELADHLGVESLKTRRTILSFDSSESTTELVTVELESEIDVLTAMRRVVQVPQVLWAAPNFVYDTFDPRDAAVNDPRFPNQYHHPLMENADAWDITLGAPEVIIAVTDDGVDLTHPDLADGIWTNTGETPGNNIDDDGNGYIDDVNGWDFVDDDNDPNPNPSDFHGTHVIGISAARTNNAIGVAGVAGSTTIMPLKFFDGAQTARFTSDVIAETFAYAVDNGAHIVNTSYNVDFFVGDPVYTAGLQYVHDQGALHFNSAGNGRQLNPPRQAFEQSIMVASTDSADKRSVFSNYGEGIDIAAPGTSILSTLKNGTYGNLSGTSMATPNAAGTAALIWSAHPDWTRDQVAAQLLGTADDIDSVNPGLEGWLGTGRVNSLRALTETLAAPNVVTIEGLPADGGLVTSISIASFQLEFDQLMDLASANDPLNYELRHAGDDRQFGTADDTLITLTMDSPYMVGTNAVSFSLTDGPLDFGDYRLTLSAGGLQNPFGTALDGDGDGNGGDDLMLNFRVAPRPFSATAPLGSLTYSTDFESIIATPGELDKFFFDLDEGQRMSVRVIGDATLKPMVQIVGPTGGTLAQSAGPGPQTYVQNVLTTDPGTYEVHVWGEFDTMGNYAAEIHLNAAFEEESVVGIDNGGTAGAENLAGSALSLGTQAAERMAVVGALSGPSDTLVDGEKFESGSLDGDWTTLSSSPDGQVTVSSAYGAAEGVFGMFMSTVAGGSTTGNEAVWAVDLSDVVTPLLRFSHASWDDQLDALPASYAGSVPGDGVAISNDETNWYRVVDLLPQPPGEWQTYTVDLAAAAAAAGISLTSPFHIKFQNLGAGEVLDGGRGFDAVEIFHQDNGEDWYALDIGDGEALSFAAVSSNGALQLELYASDGASLLASGVTASNVAESVTAFIDQTTDAIDETYFMRVTGDEANYRLIATRRMEFDLESGVGYRQALTTNRLLGFVAASFEESAEPDDVAAGTLLDNAFNLVTLSNTAGGSVVAASDPSPAAGTNKIFAPDGSGLTWTEGGDELRADFAVPVQTVSIDVMADDIADMAVLRAHDARGELLATVYSATVFAGETRTLSVTRDALDIASVTVAGVGVESVLLDNLRFELADGEDFVSLAAEVDDVISITTLFPGDGPLDPVNGLVVGGPDPIQLSLFAPDGSVAAAGTTGLSHVAQQTGTYELLVESLGGLGEYYLEVTGLSGKNVPAVLASTPADSQLVGQFPSTYRVTFSESLRPASFDAADLVVNGSAATHVELIDGNVIEFTLDPAGDVGPDFYTVTMAADAVEDLQGEGNLAFAATFEVDGLQPFDRVGPDGSLVYVSRNTVSSLVDASDEGVFRFATHEDETVAAIITPDDPAVTLTVELEGITGPIQAAGPGMPAVLPISEGSVSGESTLVITGDAGTAYSVDVYRNASIEDLVTTDGLVPLSPLNINLGFDRYAAVGSLHGSPLDAQFTTYADPSLFVDIATTGAQLDLGDDAATQIDTTVGNAVFPAGQVTIGNNGGIIAGGDHNLPLNNQSLPAPQFSAPALLPFWDDLGDTAGNVYWEERLIEGINTLIVQWEQRPHFDSDDTATFQLQLFETGNVAARFVYEDVNFGLPAVDFGASASIGVQTSRTDGLLFSDHIPAVQNGDVVDLLYTSSVVDTDEFTVDLSDHVGASIDIIVSGMTDVLAAANLELLDASGKVVISGEFMGGGAANYDVAILGHEVTTGGEHTVRISGSDAGQYSLLFATDTVFDIEPNGDSNPLRRVHDSQTAWGFVDGSDWYELKLFVGETVVLRTATLLDNPHLSPENTLDPRLEIVNPNGDVVASDLNSRDGKNASLTYTAAEGGIYRVVVGSESGSGEYLLETSSAGIVDADFNDDGVFFYPDIDALIASIIDGSNDGQYDLNDDGLVNLADLDQWLVDGAAANGLPGPYLYGDANLSGAVDVSDFNVWNSFKFLQTFGWRNGDYNADGVTDVADFNLWNANKFKVLVGTTITIGDGIGVEGDAMVFDVTSSVAVDEHIQLDFSLLNGTALVGVDVDQSSLEYSTDGGVTWHPGQGANGTRVTLAAGATALQVRLQTLQDAWDETTETFTLRASSFAVGNGTVRRVIPGIGSIVDDDATPILTVGNTTVTENADAFAVLPIMLSGPSGEAIELSLDLVDLNASGGGQDYGSGGADNVQYSLDAGATWENGNSVILPPALTSLLVRTPIFDDLDIEGAEKFRLDVNVVGGTTLNSSAGGSATILDDDAPMVAISDASADEGAPLLFDVTFSQASTEDVVLRFMTYDISASGNNDYETTGFEYSTDGGTTWLPAGGGSGTEVTVTAGQTAFQLRVNSLQDTVDEPDEIFRLGAMAISGAVMSITDGTGTILDDDAPTVTIGDVSADEGDPLVFDVTLSSAATEDIVLQFSTTDVSATGDTDYETTGFEYSTDGGTSWLDAANGTEVTVTAGTTSFQLRIDSLEDTDDEPDETFTLDATATSGTVSTITAGTGTILDDDAPTVTIGDGSADEGDPLVFDVTLSSAATEDIVLQFSTTDISATGDTDYETTGFEYSTDGGTTWLAADGASQIEVTVTAGTTAFQLRIDSLEDMDDEPDETFTLDATATSGTVSSIAAGTGTILDDDAPVVTIGDGSADEGDPLVFDVTLSIASTEDIVLQFSTTDISAMGDTDYETTGFEYSTDGGTTWLAANGANQTEVTVTAGTTAFQLRIDSLEDTDDEPDETFTLDATATSGSVSTITAGTGTILDDDAPVVTIGDGSADEGDPLVFDVTLSSAATEDIVLQFSTTDISATGDTDYETTGFEYSTDGGTSWLDAANGTEVTVTAGTTAFQLRIDSLEDTDDEPDETFTLDATATSGTVSSITAGTGTILDDDAPVVTIGDGSADEGDPLVFDVTLSSASTEDIVLQFSTTDISATGDTDYETTGFEYSTDGGTTWLAAANGTEVTVTAGTTAFQLRIDSLEDTDDEPDETFTLDATATSGTVSSITAGTGTILDDDAPVVTIGDGSADEGDPLVFDVTLSSAATEDIVLQFSTTDISATGDTDYETTGFEYSTDDGTTWLAAANGTEVTVTAGATAFQLRIDSLEDTDDEPDETFTLDATATSGTVSTITAGTGTILDDDAPVVTIGDGSADEGDPLVFDVTLSSASTEDIVLQFSTTDISATGDTDYETTGFEYSTDGGTSWLAAANGTEVTVTAGTTAFQLRIDSLEDTDDEPDETFTLDATATSGTVSSITAGTGTILDDDAPVVTIGDGSADEGDPLVFDVTLSSASTEDIVLQFSTTDISATGDTDYETTGFEYSTDGGTNWLAAANGTDVTVTAGATAFQLRIDSLEDTDDEPDETFTLDATATSGSVTSITAGTGTILDDDAPVVTIGDGSADEGDPLVFDVTLSSAATEDIVLQFSTTDISATGDTDYETTGFEYSTDGGTSWLAAANGTEVTVTAGATAFQLRIDSLEDTDDEPDETFTLDATATSGSVTSITAGTGTILDDDAPVVTIGDGSADEGDPLVFDVTLSSASTEDIVLQFSTTDISATGDTDYETTGFEYSTDGGTNWLAAANGTEVTVTAGTTAFQLRIDSLEDTDDEPDETFTLDATATSGIVSSITAGTGTILDDDAPVVTIGDGSADEGDPLVFDVTLSSAATEDIVLQFSTSDISATGDTDYETTGFEYSTDGGTSWLDAANGTEVTVTAGTTAFQLRIDSLEDTDDEPDETFTLDATATSGIVSSITAGTGTILDDDAPVVTIGDGSADEGDPLVFDVTLSSASTEDIVLQFSTTDVSATGDTDYETTNLEYSTDGGATWLAAGGTNQTDVTVTTGTTAFQLRIDSLEDTDDEPDETFTLDASATSGTVDSIIAGTGTILDDDPPTVTIGDGSADEGDPLVFDVTLSHSSVADIALTFFTTGMTATDGVDYENTEFEFSLDGGDSWSRAGGPDKTKVTIPAGVAVIHIRIDTLEDTDIESDEMFTLDATATTGTVSSIIAGTGTILDDDAPTVTIGDGSADEGDPLVFDVTLSGPSTEDIVFQFSTTDISATGDSDYEMTGFEYSTDGGTTWLAADGANQTEVTVTAGTTAFQLRIDSLEDTDDEPDETFTLDATATSGSVQSITAGTGAIINDDDPSLTIGSGSAVEGGALVFNVTLSHASDEDIVVVFSSTDVTATGGTDYETTDFEYSTDGGATWLAAGGVSATEVTVVAGDTSIKLRLDSLEDTTDESIEIFILNATVTSGTVSSINAGSGTIIDNDLAPTLSVGDVTVTEGTDSYAQFTISLSNPSAADIGLNLTLADGTADGMGVDYGSTSGDNLEVSLDGGQNWTPATSLTIVAGSTSALARTPILDDALEEPAEDFTLTIMVSSGSTANSSAIATGTILDDDSTGSIIDSNPDDWRVASGESGAETGESSRDSLLASIPVLEELLGDSSQRGDFGKLRSDSRESTAIQDEIMANIDNVLTFARPGPQSNSE